MRTSQIIYYSPYRPARLRRELRQRSRCCRADRRCSESGQRSAVQSTAACREGLETACSVSREKMKRRLRVWVCLTSSRDPERSPSAALPGALGGGPYTIPIPSNKLPLTFIRKGFTRDHQNSNEICYESKLIFNRVMINLILPSNHLSMHPSGPASAHPSSLLLPSPVHIAIS